MHMDRYLNVTEARRKLLDLVEGLQTGDRVIITKHGRPRAVLVDSERLALLEDAAWVLQDPGRRAAMQRSWDELRRGEVVKALGRGAPTVAALRRVRARRRGRR
jgi:prevent-host-death family protein